MVAVIEAETLTDAARLCLLGKIVLGLVLGLGLCCAGAVLMGTAQWLASPAVAQGSPHGPVFVLHPQR